MASPDAGPAAEPSPPLPAANAVPEAADETPSSHRELAGHRFLPSHTVPDPFSVTSFASYLGLISGEALGPSFVWGLPPTIEQNSKWCGSLGLSQQFDLRVRILEYLSDRIGFSTGAFQGLGDGSALVVGSTIRVAADADVMGSLPVGKHLRFGLSFGAA